MGMDSQGIQYGGHPIRQRVSGCFAGSSRLGDGYAATPRVSSGSISIVTTGVRGRRWRVPVCLGREISMNRIRRRLGYRQDPAQ